MRTLIAHALAGLVSVAAGFAIARSFRSENKVSASSFRSTSREPTEVSVPTSINDAPAESKNRIHAVLTLGEKQRDLDEDRALFNALEKLDAHDLLAGADEFAALLKKQDSRFGGQPGELAEAWIERWLDVDGPGALRWLASSSVLDERNFAGSSMRNRVSGVPGSIFNVLARRHSEWLRGYLATLKPGKPRDVGIYQLLREGARLDEANARTLLAEYAESPNRAAAVQGCVSGLSEVDFRAGFDLGAAEPAGPFRKELLETALRESASRGTGAVGELLDRIDDPALRRELAAGAVLEISWRSRENPLPWIMEEAERSVPAAAAAGPYDTWNSNVAQAMREYVDATAADWAVTLPNDPEKRMFAGLLGEWVNHDGPGARAWLTEHAAELNTTAVEKLGGTITYMARTDADATRAWAAALPPGGLRELAQFQIALGAGAEGDIAQAAAAYGSVADPKGDLAKQLATVIAKQDGAAAAEWAMAMPDGPSRASAITAVARQWTRHDPRGAAEWLGRMPAGAEHDDAVREYATTVVFADPAAASEWVTQVADPNVRADAAAKVFGLWSLEDPMASRAWLRELPGVDEKWRTDFLKAAK